MIRGREEYNIWDWIEDERGGGEMGNEISAMINMEDEERRMNGFTLIIWELGEIEAM